MLIVFFVLVMHLHIVACIIGCILYSSVNGCVLNIHCSCFILLQEVKNALADPVFMRMYRCHTQLPEYATVMEELLLHHEHLMSQDPKIQRQSKKRRASLQTTLFREQVSAESSTYTYTYRKRMKKDVRKARLVKQVGGIILQASRGLQQIKCHCLAHDPGRITLLDVSNAHRTYHDKNTPGRKTWLLDQIAQADDSGYLVETGSGGDCHRFRVCTRCFSSFNGFNRSTLQRRVKQFKAGVRRAVPVDKCATKSHRSLILSEWLIDKSKSYGDYMPDALAVVLPVYTKKELYRWYKRDHARDCFHYNAFCRVIRLEFPFIRFRRHKKFTQCRFCNKLDNKISKSRVSTHHFLYIHSCVYIYAIIAYTCLLSIECCSSCCVAPTEDGASGVHRG